MEILKLKEEIRDRFPGGIVEWKETNPRRFYVEIRPEVLRALAGFLYGDQGFRFNTASGVHLLRGFEALYHFSCDKIGLVISLRVKLGENCPEVDSIADLVPAADWIEREMAELLGISFKGRPGTEPLLASEDWPKDEYPLRKDFGEKR